MGHTIDLDDYEKDNTSSNSLIFPHHENEVAICEAATGQPFVRYWLHSEQVLMNGRKMSRTQHNYVTVDDLLRKGYRGREIRFFLLATHYRKPLHVDDRRLYAARGSLERLDHYSKYFNFLQE